MITHKIVPAIFGMALIAAPIAAIAATGGTMSGKEEHQDRIRPHTYAAQCSKLESQFDAALKTHQKAAKLHEAKMLRTEGQNLCTGGQSFSGVAKLKQAIKDLGVTIQG